MKGNKDDLVTFDILLETMQEIDEAASKDDKFRDVNFNEIKHLLESALKMKANDRTPRDVLEQFNLEIYVAAWMPPGEIWLFDGAHLEDSVNLFAKILLAGVRGGLPFTPSDWTTENIVQMFHRYMAAQAGGRIVGLATDESGGIDWPKSKTK